MSFITLINNLRLTTDYYFVQMGRSNPNRLGGANVGIELNVITPTEGACHSIAHDCKTGQFLFHFRPSLV